MKLLHIDSSILADHSASRALSAQIVARLKAMHPDLEVTYHDLASESVRHLSGAHLAGDAAHDEALSADVVAGGRYLQEVLDTDLLVIGTPMYNFGIPSQLKAWVDRVLVAGKTFRYGANGPEGLATGKKAYIGASRGGLLPARRAGGVDGASRQLSAGGARLHGHYRYHRGLR